MQNFKIHVSVALSYIVRTSVGNIMKHWIQGVSIRNILSSFQNNSHGIGGKVRKEEFQVLTAANII